MINLVSSVFYSRRDFARYSSASIFGSVYFFSYWLRGFIRAFSIVSETNYSVSLVLVFIFYNSFFSSYFTTLSVCVSA